MKNLKKAIIYTLLFTLVFAYSAVYTTLDILGLGGKNVFTLQGDSKGAPLGEGAVKKQVINIKYITGSRKIDSREIVLYRPAGEHGDIPLIYIPHYAAEEKSEDFKLYIQNGWAVASPHRFESKYNAQLAGDGLVFNNAALYTLRHTAGIDKQRIAVAGSSAGGYTALMLSELQMGAAACIANAPIANVYFNFHVHFAKCDSINANSAFFDFPLPVQGMISKLFRPINDQFKNENDPLWEALSPASMPRALSSPTVINHNTGDILVPADQITKRYSYKGNDGTLPKDFSAEMGRRYPGTLSLSLEEQADPDELSLRKYRFALNRVFGAMPYSGKLLTINIIDDGPVSAKGSHSAPGTTGNFNTIPFLKHMFARTLKQTEKPMPEKLLLLLERYQGKSRQLPAHIGLDDALYGSLAVYKKEIIDQLALYRENHSLGEIDAAMKAAIGKSQNESRVKAAYLAAWEEVKNKL